MFTWSYKSSHRALVGAACLLSACSRLFADAPANRLIDRADYAERLRAMWLAETIADWTDIVTEGARSAPPFFTDADWGTAPFPDRPWLILDYVLDEDPWPADDDTDIEYVYLHALATLNSSRLTPGQISDHWTAHINRYIWVSNYAARQLIEIGAVPPMTTLGQALHPSSPVDRGLMIDAQLTTEFFGALCPGMPERALDMADLPIRTTARSHAAHAAQFFVVLYSLATQVDQSLPRREQALWLVAEARKFIPDSSKAADIIDFVVADFLANPDINDWESTRDKIYQRYRANAAANGFVYRDWFESSVNLATAVMELLYGELDLGRTIQIGAVAGWDSENGPATLCGLICLIRGPAALDEEGWTSLADTYWALRTRDNLPDHTPSQDGEDTFTLMAERALPIIDREVLATGGLVSTSKWLLPPGGAGPGVSHTLALARSPTHQEFLRSANQQVRALGGFVTASTDVPGWPDPEYGSSGHHYMADGLEHDWRGIDETSFQHFFYTTQRPGGNPPGIEQTLTVTYTLPVEVHTIRFMGSRHFASGPVQGGWFASFAPEVLVGGQWIAPALSPAGAPAGFACEPGKPFPLVDFVLAAPVTATAIRVRGLAGGSPGGGFVTCMELDALSTPIAAPVPSFDRDADGTLTIDDLYSLVTQPADLNADGTADTTDARYLEAALRFGEAAGMATSR